MNANASHTESLTNALKRAFGDSAVFRDGQLEAIGSLLNPGTRLFVVERTGWGKSVVYFLATQTFRARGAGPTLIISPLLSLMRNQIAMAEKFGLRAATIDSTNEQDWESIAFEIAADALDVLLVSPERLGNVHFRDNLLPIFEERAGLVVIDEAHCISDWGHDFRPDYQRIIGFVQSLNDRCSILATTATATERVVDDVTRQLGGDVLVQRGPLMRDSLRLSAFRIETHAERLAWLVKYLPRFPGSGIVYTLTVYDAEQVAEFLHRNGIVADAYHADLEHDDRVELERKFQANELKVLVATTALGMGYDKADVGFVVHYALPTSILGYYQQIGRAGRMLDSAYAALLWSEDDAETAKHFFETAMPPRAVFENLLARLSDAPVEMVELKSAGPWSMVLQALDVLEVDGVVHRDLRGFRLNSEGKTFNFDKIRELREARWKDYEHMQAFARGGNCRMATLARALGDAKSQDCGKCDVCKPRSETSLTADDIVAAENFLREATFPIEPKKRMPAFEGLNRSTSIAEGERLQAGIALSSYNDSGYGRAVRAGKYGPFGYSDELLEPAVEAIVQSGFEADWIAWVPSHDNGKVKEFAIKLSEALRIPAHDCVKKVVENRPQKLMRYSRAQLENVWDAFEVVTPLPGRCLLFDDIVDSGWTLTVIGMRLRAAGASEVMPFALATSRPRRKR